jgi:prepilin-type N-terminal cleavage/methylation domain-containing protein
MQHPAPLQRSRPSGFTLVELLAVIMIIAMLAGLLTPAVMRSLASARNAAIKSEIDMLHMAMMNYKTEFGILPPCIDSLVSGTYSSGGTAAKHLKRLFPRCPDTAYQLNTVFQTTAGIRVELTPVTSLTTWLAGFTTDPQSPLIGKRQKLYDFDNARINATSQAYTPSGKPGSHFIYIDSARYLTVNTSGTFSYGGQSYYAQRIPAPGAAATFNNLAQPAFNPDTFQILCAGADQEFGNEDDMSNFWPGTRGDYIESLKQ